MSESWLSYLRAYQCLGDRELSDDFLRTNCKWAAEVRDQVPCSMVVPEDIFLNYVLPYACLDERRDAWREKFFTRFQEHARRSASIEDCVVSMNRLVFDTYDVQYHPTKRPHNNMSALESIECGFASCTGLSIMIVSALRAVGIPARIVGTPLWADRSGNHTWFEVWDHGAWHFLGAAEPGPYDRCWFNDIARETTGIYAACFGPSDDYFHMEWDSENTSVNGIDLTASYHASAPTPEHPTRITIEPKGYVCPRVTGPVTIDGDLEKPVWRDVPWTDYFVDIEGARKLPPRHHTRAKMMWDDRYLYIGAMLEDPHLWGTLTEKNAIIFNDNDFEVFIDPDGDRHNYYEFEINALGTIWELSLDRPYRDGGPVHRGDNMPGICHAVKLYGSLNDPSDTDLGWSVELAIPWSGLQRYAGTMSCPPESGDQWRMNFSRVHWLHEIIDGRYVKVPREAHPEDNWVWSPQEAIDMHRPERWGLVQFDANCDAPFMLDECWPLRELLMELYDQQRERDEPSVDIEDFTFRGVRDPELLEYLRIERGIGEQWRASGRVGPHTLQVDDTGRLQRL
ncbi:MAG: hypothetical protein ACI9TH_000066 [Kiritimatiellia bacterium]|jgi:hypothetical protein